MQGSSEFRVEIQMEKFTEGLASLSNIVDQSDNATVDDPPLVPSVGIDGLGAPNQPEKPSP